MKEVTMALMMAKDLLMTMLTRMMIMMMIEVTTMALANFSSIACLARAFLFLTWLFML